MRLIVDHASRFCAVRVRVLNVCVTNLATVIAHLELSGQRRLVGFEDDPACFQNKLSSLVEAYVKPVLSLDFYVAGEKEATEASKVFVKKMSTLVPR